MNFLLCFVLGFGNSACLSFSTVSFSKPRVCSLSALSKPTFSTASFGRFCVLKKQKPQHSLWKFADDSVSQGHLTVLSSQLVQKSENRKPDPQKGLMVYWLVLANVVIYVLGKNGLSTTALYLNHSKAAWYQLITSLFCHASLKHLNSNLFPLLVFGRLVEDELGGMGLLLSYLVCGACSCLASIFLVTTASTFSLGASGSIFGLFTVAILSRLSIRGFSWRSIIEAAVFGYYVWERIYSEVAITAGGGLVGVNHVAHLSGAAAGVALVMVMRVLLAVLEAGEDRRRARADQ